MATLEYHLCNAIDKKQLKKPISYFLITNGYFPYFINFISLSLQNTSFNSILLHELRRYITATKAQFNHNVQIDITLNPSNSILFYKKELRNILIHHTRFLYITHFGKDSKTFSSIICKALSSSKCKITCIVVDCSIINCRTAEKLLEFLTIQSVIKVYID